MLFLAIVLVALAFGVNIVSVQFTARVNNVAVVTEIVGMVVAAIAIFVLWVAKAEPAPLGAAVLGEHQGHGLYGFAMAGLIGIYTVVGFEFAADLAEETVNPRRIVPKAIIFAVVSAGVLGMISLIGFTIAIPDLDAVMAAPLPLVAISQYWLGSALTTVFLVFVVFSSCTSGYLILDDVRAGFRYDVAGSWEPIGVRPDLSAFSKAIANGHPLATVTGTDALREAAGDIFVTGSFWYSGSAMAAAVATLTELRDTDALARIARAGVRLRDGLVGQAARHGVAVTHSGPVQMPLLVFDDDPGFATAVRWTGLAAERGVYLHPHHNWFLSAAHTDADIDDALQRTDDAFAALGGVV